MQVPHFVRCVGTPTTTLGIMLELCLVLRPSRHITATFSFPLILCVIHRVPILIQDPVIATAMTDWSLKMGRREQLRESTSALVSPLVSASARDRAQLTNTGIARHTAAKYAGCSFSSPLPSDL